MAKTLQLLRNSSLYATHDAAVSALQTKLASAADGEPVLARYYTGTQGQSDYKERTLLGIKSAGGYEIFDNQGGNDAIKDAIDALVNGATEDFDTLGEIETYIKDLDASSVADDNKVVTDVTQADGQITATASNITGVKLAGYTVASSAADVAATDTLGQALGKLQKYVDDMQLSQVGGGNGDVLTAVSEADGKVSASKSALSDVLLTGYAKTNDTGDIAATDSVEVALSKLENKSAATTVKSTDKTVTIKDNNGKDLSVNIDTTTLVKDSSTGAISTNLEVVALDSTEIAALPDNNVKEAYKLIYHGDANRTAMGGVVKIYKDSALQEVYLGSDQDTINATTGVITKVSVADPQSMNFAYQLADGTYSLTKIDVSKFLTDSEFADGLQVSGEGVVSVKKDATSGKVRIAAAPAEGEDTGLVDVLSVSSDGVKVNNIQAAIDYKVSTLDASDTAVAGQYVSAVTETDGVISVSRTNVSGAVLNGYAKGSDDTDVAATDTINAAISKLENQIDAAGAGSKTVINTTVSGESASHMTITKTTDSTDGHDIYAFELADVASEDALEAEVTRAKSAETSIDSVVGLTKGSGSETRTYTNTGTYIGKETTNTVKSDIAALDTELANALNGVAAGNGINVGTKASKSQTITAVAVTNDPIIEVTTNGIGTKDDAVWDCGSYDTNE